MNVKNETKAAYPILGAMAPSQTRLNLLLRQQSGGSITIQQILETLQPQPSLFHW